MMDRVITQLGAVPTFGRYPLPHVHKEFASGSPSPFLKENLHTHWRGVKLHALTVFGIGLLHLIIDNPCTTLVAGGTVCFFVYVTLAVLEAKRAPLRFSPLSFYFGWYSIALGVSPVFVGIVSKGVEPVSLSVVSIPATDIALGYVIFLAGSVALHAGFQIFRPGFVQDSNDAGDLPVNILWLGLLWACGVLVLLIPAWSIYVGAPGRVFRFLALSSVCTFALTPPAALGISKGTLRLFLVLGIIGLFVANLSSLSKAYILFSFLPLVWLLLLRHSLRLWLIPLGCGLLILYLAALAPVVHEARNAPLEPGVIPQTRMLRSFTNLLDSGEVSFDETVFATRVENYLYRQFDPIPVGFFVGEVKESGFQLGATMDYVLYAFIPRLLWRDKPGVTRGGWFTYYLGASPSEEEATTSTGITAIGELYWNFGIAGVLAGMFVLGTLLGGLWRMAGSDPRRQPLHMLLYVVVMLGMPNMSEAVTVLVSITASYLTFKAMFVLLEALRRKKQSYATAIS